MAPRLIRSRLPRALDVDDLVIQIFDYLEGDSDALLYLACTSRRFFPFAASYIWKSLTPGGINALRTMAARSLPSYSHMPSHVSDRALQVGFYGGMVRSIEVHMHDLYHDLSQWRGPLRTLRRECANVHIFSLLRKVSLSLNEPEHLRVCSSLISKSVTDLSLHFHSGGDPKADWSPAYSKLRDRLVTIEATLNDLTISGMAGLNPLAPMFAKSASKYISLIRIDIPASLLSESSIRHIALLPRLRRVRLQDMTVALAAPWPAALLGIADPFRTLTSVTIDGSLASIIKVLRLLPPGLSTLRVDAKVHPLMTRELPSIAQLASAHHPTLTTLSIRLSTPSFDDAFPFSWSHLQPLLKCRRLRIFFLLFDVRGAFPFDDACMREMGTAWSDLRSFTCMWQHDRKYRSHGIVHPNDVTFQGVVTLGSLAPHLQHVSVSHVDFTDTSTEAPIGGSLRSLAFDSADFRGPVWLAAMITLTGRDWCLVGLPTHIQREVDALLINFRASLAN